MSDVDFKTNYPLSDLTTFRIGGPALKFVEVLNENELKLVLALARRENMPVLVIGGGSNILVSDKGFQGLVIKNKITGLSIEDSGLVKISAGENWDDVVARVIEKDLAGIECLSGIPGSGGGAVVQNVGAYGETLGDFVVGVRAIEVATGFEREFQPKECEFEYRSSWFKKNLNKYIVVDFQIKLRPHGAPTISYPHVKKHFETKTTPPSLSDVRQFIIKLRASKGYLIMPGYESFATAGSYFKNPVVNIEEYERLKPLLGDQSLNRFWKTENGVKLAAAFLMQEAGFEKGYRDGTVGISPKHSLSLVNLGGAKASAILDLANRIKDAVFEKFGVKLEEEVLFVGEI